ncbi:MAG: ScbA/BarX family gamma-butyrolactone biosynthesis protein [Solirubrobacteraceae bacterium]|nr:ScbA/BarX family gamma-butyrolactone biosynthesis protein [Solirubrobacteraceae bacterium]
MPPLTIHVPSVAAPGAATEASRPSDLSFSTTVERGLVHRAAVCEVFLTDSARLDQGRFALAAQLPRTHAYFSDHLSAVQTYDPLLLLEVCRQASILVAHRYLGVGADQKFVFGTGEFAVTDRPALRIGARPAQVVLVVDVIAEKRRGDELVGVTYEMEVWNGDFKVFTETMAIQWMPGSAWSRIRRRGRDALGVEGLDHPLIASGLDPALVGRAHAQNVVLGDAVHVPGGIEASVRIDRDHPALFDHELDHVPGMLIFEALRQTAIVAAHEGLGYSPARLVLDRAQVRFTRFGEFEIATRARAQVIEPRAGGGAEVRLAITQDGVPIAEAEASIGVACLQAAPSEVAA